MTWTLAISMAIIIYSDIRKDRDFARAIAQKSVASPTLDRRSTSYPHS